MSAFRQSEVLCEKFLRCAPLYKDLPPIRVFEKRLLELVRFSMEANWRGHKDATLQIVEHFDTPVA